MLLGTLLKRTLAPAALCALAISACGSQHQPPTGTTASTSTGTTTGPTKRDDNTVYIYSSLPLGGPERAGSLQIQRGIGLALKLAGSRSGVYRIRYRHLNDAALPATRRRRRGTATPSGNHWNETATVLNAELAARNPQTVAVIGNLDSGATARSLPILNQAGILQLTPGSGYPGLTDSYSKYKGITQQGEPLKYYPQSTRTLLRLIPSDIVQAAAALDALVKTGCQHFSAWQFGGAADPPEAAALLNAVIHTAPLYKMVYSAPPPLSADTGTYGEYATSLNHAGVRCAVLVGHPTPAAVALTTELREQLPVGSAVVGTSGFCTARWLRGIPKSLVAHVATGLYCTTPRLPVEQYLDGRHFIGLFERAYHHPPTAYDYYGYEAATLVIKALYDIGGRTDPRAKVASYVAGDIASYELGLYIFNDNGDLESNAYGIDSLADGILRHYRTVTRPHLLPSAG